MADIVGVFASSHTPQVSLGLDLWESHGDRDEINPLLLGKDYEYHTYEELLADADPTLEAELRPEVWEAKYQRARAALAELTQLLAEARPDAAVVIGDDQFEMFQADGLPTFALFTGGELWGGSYGEVVKGEGADASGERDVYPVHEELNRHLVEALVDDDFDLTVFSEQPGGRSLGHAFVFPRHHLGLDPAVPMVPLFVNTYYPPNTPSAARAYRLGQTAAQAISSWDTDARVVVIASGGLSHFVVDEDLDRRFLDGIASGDPRILGSFTRRQLRSGTSELLNWIIAAGAGEKLQPRVLDYLPGYRTPAGTGCGLAFAHWS